jgi:putative solute:sodium symporter small subunit
LVEKENVPCPSLATAGSPYSTNVAVGPAQALARLPPTLHGEEGNHMTPERRQMYWGRNLKIVLQLLAVWFIVSYGFGILLVNWLDGIQFFGFKLGFWFAQNGSIYIFVALIFIYVRIMNQLDREHDVHED